jgi:tape measure domain-containing protein
MLGLEAFFSLNDKYSKTLRTITMNQTAMDRAVLKTSSSVDQLDNKLNNIGGKSLNKLIGAIGGIAAVIKGGQIADEYANTQARLAQVNDGLQTQAKLQDEIFMAAERARGSYMGMTQAVAKMGMMAGDSFKNNKELVQFTELVQKSFKVGGASGSEQKAGMLQLTQAMASGRLQGDEFRSITENAPLIAQAIEKSVGVSRAELRKMSADGKITADMIKNAMLGAATDIETKFSKMPKTLGDHMTSIQNHALKTFGDTFNMLSEVINNEGFISVMNGIKGSISLAAYAVQGLIMIVDLVGQTVVNNWGIIEPILFALVFVLLPAAVFQLWLMIAPILAQAAAWAIANAPLIILILLVAIFFGALVELGFGTEEIIGGIVGTFYWLGAVVYNVFAGIYNVGSMVAEFFTNLFVSPLNAVIGLFNNMALEVNKILLGVAQQIDNILNALPWKFKSNIAGFFEGTIKTIEANKASLKEKGYIELPKMEYKDLNSSFEKGYNKGSTLGSGFKNGGLNIPDMNSAAFTPQSIELPSNMGAMPVETKGGKSLDVKIDKEDLKYLKDIAERDYVAKYNTNAIAPQIHVQFGDIKETADANKVKGIVTKILQEEIAVLGEG